MGAGPDLAPIAAVLRDGRRVLIRPVCANDADAFRAAFARLSAETRYNRFMGAVRELSDAVLRRAVSNGGAGELALVAVAIEGDEERIVAGARYIAEADGKSCEFAITVADGWQRIGLASLMMKTLVNAARTAGLECMRGYVLASNRPMLELARRFGFQLMRSDEGPAVRLVRLELGR